MDARRIWLWGSVTAAGLLLAWSTLAEGGFRRYLRLEGELEALRARSAQLRDENTRLTRELEALRESPLMQERAVREELGFVRPGELVIDVGAQ